MKNLLKLGLIAVFSASILMGCNCFKSAAKKTELLKINATQSPVSLNGEMVPFSAEVSYPEKFIADKATYKVTPVFIYEGGEFAATPQLFQGASVEDNYIVLSSEGGVARVESSVKYSDELRNSKLVMRLDVKCDAKSEFIHLTDLDVAKGVSIIQQLTTPAKVAFAKDNFKRVTQESQNANIMFSISSSTVSKAQLNSEEVDALKNFIVENSNNERRTLSSITTKAFASPDGPLKLNDKLSVQRGNTTKKSIDRDFKRNKIASEMTVDALGEDWEGFKILVQNSDIAEKDMILQILNMYNDPARRNEEIKNMSSVFTILAEKILPQLRRSQMSVQVEIQGYTDEELKNLVATDITVLNLEELLFAATLFCDLETKNIIYSAAIAKAPKCIRAINNLGAVEYLAGNIEAAKTLFILASEINADAPFVINNLAAVALTENDAKDAEGYLIGIIEELPEAKCNLGLAYIKMGKYTEAIKYETSTNKAIAQILVGDYAGAKQSIKGNCACDYTKSVKALIAAKEGDFTTAEELAAELMIYTAETQAEIELMK